MIAKPTHPYLGKGIYSPSEAAFYSRVRPQTFSRWFFGNKSGQAVISPDIETHTGERIVTFLDFVQSLAIRAIRTRHKVSLQKIREAVEVAKAFNVEHPFAVKHTTFLFGAPDTPGHGDVVIQVDGKLLQASGKAKRNLVMKQVAELYMRDLHFDAETGLASSYTAWRGHDGNRVIMDPRKRFGEPILEDCGYTAETLVDAYEIEGSVEAAAEACDVQPEDIELALSYYDYLTDPA